MKQSIFLAALFHETHSFLDELTCLSDFSRSGWGTPSNIRLPGSPMAAAIERFEAEGWDCLAGPYYNATPSGVVEDLVLETWFAEFKRAWEAHGEAADAIYLVLHGAMITESESDVEALIVERIRALEGAGDIPIYAVMDLHGNISKRFTEQMNGFLAYRENPHRDACVAAQRVAEMMIRAAAQSEQLKSHWSGTNLLWPPTGTATDLTPMLDLERIARRWEGEPGIYGVNVFSGYSFGDTFDTGVTFSVVAAQGADQSLIERIFSEMNATATAKRLEGTPQVNDVEDLLGAIAEGRAGPILVAEPSDNIGGGAPGDCTGLLRIFLDLAIEGAAVIINDPGSVQALQSSSGDSLVKLQIGGRGSKLDEGPLPIGARLLRLFKGVFDLEDPRSHLAAMAGSRINMGDCALIEYRGVTILLTSFKTPPFDLGQWRIAGVNPEQFRVIGVKAAVAYRQAYDPIASAHLTLDTPGPCSSDLQRLQFEAIRRPVFPLDDI